MVRALRRGESDEPPHRITNKEAIIGPTARITLFDFVSANISEFFVSLNINHDFLKVDPRTWDTNPNTSARRHWSRNLRSFQTSLNAVSHFFSRLTQFFITKGGKNNFSCRLFKSLDKFIETLTNLQLL